MSSAQGNLIVIEKRSQESDAPSCHIERPLNLPPTKRYKYRMIALAAVHAYIAFHLISWHVFGIQIWGKTAMMGVPSLAKGTINAAAIMVILILLSIFFWGRGFCGWVCHMRGAIEFADWILRKLKVRQYLKLREKNVLVNTPHRWLLRIGALFVLLLPVIILITTWLSRTAGKSLFYSSVCLAAVVIWRHRSNLSRLMRGTEPRFTRK